MAQTLLTFSLNIEISAAVQSICERLNIQRIDVTAGDWEHRS